MAKPQIFVTAASGNIGVPAALQPAAAEEADGTPSAQAWFAGGERVGYDPKARAIVAAEGAPLHVFLRREGSPGVGAAYRVQPPSDPRAQKQMLAARRRQRL